MNRLDAMHNARTRDEARITGIRLFWWTVYAAAFGYVEAAVVVYIRKATGMTPGLDYRAIWIARGVPFNSAGIAAEMSRLGILRLEVTREIATLLLLAGALDDECDLVARGLRTK